MAVRKGGSAKRYYIYSVCLTYPTDTPDLTSGEINARSLNSLPSGEPPSSIDSSKTAQDNAIIGVWWADFAIRFLAAHGDLLGYFRLLRAEIISLPG